MANQQPYQLRVCDLRTDRTLSTIEIQNPTFDDFIGKTGALTGTIALPTKAIARKVRDTLLPGRTMLHLEQESGGLAWSGVLWVRTPTLDPRTGWSCPIIAAGLESWLRGHRMLVDTLTYAGADQLAIARALVTYAQGVPGGDLGIEMDTSQLSGVLRDRTYSPYDLQYAGLALDQLAAVDGGFEWRIQVYQDGATRHRALRLGYPKLSVGVADLPLSLPGEIIGYAMPEDATQQANAWISRGASVNTNQAAASVPLMSAPLTTPADYTAGWPRLDGSSDYSTVTDQATLDGHAAADLARVQRPVAIPSVTVRSSTTRPELGSYTQIRIANNDTWYQDGLLSRYRVVGKRCAPDERGRSDSTDLYLEAA